MGVNIYFWDSLIGIVVFDSCLSVRVHAYVREFIYKQYICIHTHIHTHTYADASVFNVRPYYNVYYFISPVFLVQRDVLLSPLRPGLVYERMTCFLHVLSFYLLSGRGLVPSETYICAAKGIFFCNYCYNDDNIKGGDDDDYDAFASDDDYI